MKIWSLLLWRLYDQWTATLQSSGYTATYHGCRWLTCLAIYRSDLNYTSINLTMSNEWLNIHVNIQLAITFDTITYWHSIHLKGVQLVSLFRFYGHSTVLDHAHCCSQPLKSTDRSYTPVWKHVFENTHTHVHVTLSLQSWLFLCLHDLFCILFTLVTADDLSLSTPYSALCPFSFAWVALHVWLIQNHPFRVMWPRLKMFLIVMYPPQDQLVNSQSACSTKM